MLSALPILGGNFKKKLAERGNKGNFAVAVSLPWLIKMLLPGGFEEEYPSIPPLFASVLLLYREPVASRLGQRLLSHIPLAGQPIRPPFCPLFW